MKNYIKVDVSVHNSTQDANYKYNIESLSVDCQVSNYLPNEEVFNYNIKPYVPTKGDKLYFASGCNIPRIKLKDLALEYNVKSIRNIDDADVIVVGEGVKKNMYDYNWLYKVPVEAWKKFIELHKDLLDEYEIENINTALEFYDLPDVVCDYNTKRLLSNDDYNFHDELEPLLGNDYGSTVISKINSDYKSLADTLNNTTAKIINETSILEYVNGSDAVIIDESMYEQLCTMLNSSDEDNHILAMEIMANCNYKPSLLFLELIFKNYSDKLSDSPTKRHVNFKSLLTYLGKESRYMSTYIDDVTDSLKRHNVFTKENLDILLRLEGDDIKRSGDTKAFKISTIQLQDDYITDTVSDYKFHFYKEEEVITEDETTVEEELIDLNSDNSEAIEESIEKEEVIVDEPVTEEVAFELDITSHEPEETEEEVEEVTQENVEEDWYNEQAFEIEEEIVVEIEPEINNVKEQENNDTDDFEWF